MSETEQPSLDDTAADPSARPLHQHDLSPSVRGLVKHYDLDVASIHGTGPAGRIRVGESSRSNRTTTARTRRASARCVI
jgi:pyruvate/2-oxoglutarate dehydrogenase complex dihydrolipoamide acyltransferase (E2) component